MSKPEFAIVIILRVVGVGALFSLPAVFLPYDWMNAIHAWLGLGELPEAPIVGYLARSLSAFYFVAGLATLAIVTDIRRYRPLITLWALVAVGTGALMIGVDLHAGLPLSWTLFEGPPSIVTGLVVWWLLRKSPAADE